MRLPEMDYFAWAPDWICEVLSPSTVSLDRVKKLTIYAREQVAHAWLIDPLARTLEVLHLEAGRWTILATHAGADVVRAEPFVDIELELNALWADPAEPLAASELLAEQTGDLLALAPPEPELISRLLETCPAISKRPDPVSGIAYNMKWPDGRLVASDATGAEAQGTGT